MRLPGYISGCFTGERFLLGDKEPYSAGSFSERKRQITLFEANPPPLHCFSVRVVYTMQWEISGLDKR